MHIKYPKQKGFFTWEELGCLSKALGYQKNLFYKNIPAEYHKEKIQGLDSEQLLVIIEMKVLHGDLHRTYNMHDALYNSRVIEKALDMLSNKYLSFQELREVRVAFQLYEHEDMLGLVIDEHILLRTLKACGRSVSPMKLMQHIKHTKTHVDDRLMLYEFMELLLLCERESDVIVQPVPQASGIEPRSNLYKLCDFKSILVSPDEKKISQLDKTYELSISKPHLVSKTPTQPSWRDEQPFLVDLQPRIELVSRHRPATIELADHLNHSNKKVLNARCGRTGKGGSRPFIDLNDIAQKERRDRRELKIDTPFEDIQREAHQREKDLSPTSRVNFSSLPPQEYQFTLDRPSTSDSQSYLKSFPGTTPQKLSRMSRTKDIEILVTPRDVHNANTKIENLNWDIETQTVRLQRKSDKYLQEKYPHQYQIIRRRTERRKPKSLLKRRELLQNTKSEVVSDASPSSLTHVKASPRKNIPTRENIYTQLKSRLETNDSLLDYGEIDVPYSPFSEFLSKQLQRKKTQPSFTEVNRSGPRTLKVENMGNLPGEEDLKASHVHTDEEVNDLIDKFQAADFIATGRKAFGQNTTKQQSWKHTTFV